MIHHYNHETLVVLVLFTVPFYHFSFSRYLELAECHFSSDILVPFPNLGVLYSRDLIIWGIFCNARLTLYISHVVGGQGIIYKFRAGSNPGSKWTKCSSFLWYLLKLTHFYQKGHFSHKISWGVGPAPSLLLKNMDTESKQRAVNKLAHPVDS